MKTQCLPCAAMLLILFSCKKQQLQSSIEQPSPNHQLTVRNLPDNVQTAGITASADLITLLEDATVKTIWLKPGKKFTISTAANVTCSAGDGIKQIFMADGTGNDTILSATNNSVLKATNTLNGLDVEGVSTGKRIIFKATGDTLTHITTSYSNKFIDIKQNGDGSGYGENLYSLTANYVGFYNCNYGISFNFAKASLDNTGHITITNCNFGNYTFRGISFNRIQGATCHVAISIRNNHFENHYDYGNELLTPAASWKVRGVSLDAGNNTTDNDNKQVILTNTNNFTGNNFVNSSFALAQFEHYTVSGNHFVGQSGFTLQKGFELLHLENRNDSVSIASNNFDCNNSKIKVVELATHKDEKMYVDGAGQRDIYITNNDFTGVTNAQFSIGGQGNGNGDAGSVSATFDQSRGVLIQNNTFPNSVTSGYRDINFTRDTTADHWANRFLKLSGNKKADATALPIGRVQVYAKILDTSIVGQWGSSTSFIYDVTTN